MRTQKEEEQLIRAPGAFGELELALWRVGALVPVERVALQHESAFSAELEPDVSKLTACAGSGHFLER